MLWIRQGIVPVHHRHKRIPLGFSLIGVQHRPQPSSQASVGIAGRLGRTTGAIATSCSHDSHNLLVLGRDPHDMALAANALIATGGGMALSQNGEILAQVAMPIAGMLSDLPAAQLAQQFKNLRDLSAKVADWDRPTGCSKRLKAHAWHAMPDRT